MMHFDYLAEADGMRGGAGRVRAELGRRFLAAVDRASTTESPISIAFLYAAGFYLDPEMLDGLRSRGIWTVLLALDDKQQLPGATRDGIREWQVAAARGVDLYWTTWRTGVDWLAARGAIPWYAPTGADPVLFAPVAQPRNVDVLWVGRGYGPRYALVRWLRKQGFSVESYGPGWEGGAIPFDEMVRMYGRAKIVLGMGGVGQTDAFKHLKGRDFEVPMSGAVYLTSFNPELADHFRIGEEILCYSSFVECADVLRWLLARPDVAERIRAAARERSLREHTWDSRIAAMIALLTGKDNGIHSGTCQG
jgi:hypothetical protein